MIKGDVLITTIGNYKRSVAKQGLCGKLPTELYNKVHGMWKPEKDGSYTQYTLSSEEYVELVGDAPAFGVMGIDYIYDREEELVLSISEYFDTPQLTMIHNRETSGNEFYNFPVVCGDREGMMVREEQKRIRQEPSVGNYKRLLTELQDRSKSIEKDLLYYNFFISFIAVYSDQCGDTIRDGIVRSTTYQDVNAYGDKVGNSSIIELKLGKGYVEAFDRYDTLRKENSYKPSMNSLSSPGSMMTTMVAMQAPSNYLEMFISTRGCQSKKVQTVYRHLYELEN